MAQEFSSESLQRARTKALIVIVMLMLGAFLYVAQIAFIPVAIALFLSTLLTPAVDLLQRWRMPRSLASVLVAIVILSALAATVGALWGPAKDWIEHAPTTM